MRIVHVMAHNHVRTMFRDTGHPQANNNTYHRLHGSVVSNDMCSRYVAVHSAHRKIMCGSHADRTSDRATCTSEFVDHRNHPDRQCLEVNSQFWYIRRWGSCYVLKGCRVGLYIVVGLTRDVLGLLVPFPNFITVGDRCITVQGKIVSVRGVRAIESWWGMNIPFTCDLAHTRPWSVTICYSVITMRTDTTPLTNTCVLYTLDGLFEVHVLSDKKDYPQKWSRNHISKIKTILLSWR